MSDELIDELESKNQSLKRTLKKRALGSALSQLGVELEGKYREVAEQELLPRLKVAQVDGERRVVPVDEDGNMMEDGADLAPVSDLVREAKEGELSDLLQSSGSGQTPKQERADELSGGSIGADAEAEEDPEKVERAREINNAAGKPWEQ